MKGRKHRPEQIIKKLREADAMMSAECDAVSDKERQALCTPFDAHDACLLNLAGDPKEHQR